MLAEGLQLGRYRLLRLVGRGATSEVYLAEDARVDRQVALKVVQAENLASEDARDMALLFHREAHTIARLNHPNILPLFDFGEELINDTPLVYLVMPYCPEGTLARWLRQRSGSLTLQPHEVSYIVQQAADALEYAHEQQIVHRDVKPSNFLIRSRKNMSVPDVLLADFGIARLTHGTTNTSNAIRGTPVYMSPEQWSGYAVPASDQYALAIMAYELLTGRLPFRGTYHQVMYHHLTTPPPPPSTVNLRIPSAIDEVILRALAKEPEARFPSITAFASAFQQAVQPATSHPITPFPSPITPITPTVTTLSPIVVSSPSPTFRSVRDTPDTSISDGQSNAESAITESIPGLPSPRITQKRLLLSALVLLLIIASIVGFFSLETNLSTSRATTATVSVNQGTAQAIRATSTADTTTAIAQSTKAASVTATAAGMAYPYDSPYHTLTLNETLDKNSHTQWDEIPGSCVFTAAGYHVIASAQATLAQPCVAHQTNFSDMTFEVQMNLLSGNGGGILLRASTSASYYFRISQNGYYTLSVCTETGTSCNKILTSHFSGQITQGLHQSNIIAVVARGSRIELYVNYERVDSVTDSTSSSGQIGLVAEVGSEVVFSHVRVWTM